MNNEEVAVAVQSCYDDLDRPSWDAFFMTLAMIQAQKSMDPSTKHGCVIVDDSKTILSTGYNSAPRNCNDENIPLTRPDKYPYMKHSEPNAIINAARSGTKVEGGTVYVTGFPCENCFGDMVNAGIKKIVYGPIGSHCVNEKSKEIINRINENNTIEMVLYDEPDAIFEVLEKTKKYLERKMSERDVTYNG